MKAIGYWFLQLTWGCLLTIVGGIVTLVLFLFGFRPKVFGYSIYIEVGRHWGGLNLGGFFFIQKDGNLHLKQHEYGHGFQNIFLGPLMPFLIAIPSAIRYHYRKYQRAKGRPLKPYEAIWFEKWATDLGKKYDKDGS